MARRISLPTLLLLCLCAQPGAAAGAVRGNLRKAEPAGGATASDPGAAPAAASPTGSDEDMRTVTVGAIDIVELDFNPTPNPLVGNKQILEVQQGSHPRQFKVIPNKKGFSSVH